MSRISSRASVVAAVISVVLLIVFLLVVLWAGVRATKEEEGARKKSVDGRSVAELVLDSLLGARVENVSSTTVGEIRTLGEESLEGKHSFCLLCFVGITYTW